MAGQTFSNGLHEVFSALKLDQNLSVRERNKEPLREFFRANYHEQEGI